MSSKVEVGADVYPRYMSMGTWKTKKSTRKPSRDAGHQRDAKRLRVLGNRLNQSIYTKARGYKHRSYGTLCAMVDKAN